MPQRMSIAETARLVREVARELAAQEPRAVVGTMEEITQKVNEKRIEAGYKPFTKSALRSPNLQAALKREGLRIENKRGPVTIALEEVQINVASYNGPDTAATGAGDAQEDGRSGDHPT